VEGATQRERLTGGLADIESRGSFGVVPLQSRENTSQGVSKMPSRGQATLSYAKLSHRCG
jgi:hypothetical protein